MPYWGCNMRAAAREKMATLIGLGRPSFGALALEVAGLGRADLEACLEHQRRHGGRLGEVLLARKLLTREQVSEVLRRQARWVADSLAGHSPASFPYPASLSVCLPAYNEQDNIEDTVTAACAILPE